MLSRRVLPSFLLPTPVWCAQVSARGLRSYEEGREALPTIHSVDVFFEQRTVPLALHLCHAHIDVDFSLWEKALLDVGLDATQEERSKHFVKLLNDLVAIVVPFAARFEPLVKVFAAAENVRQEEVEQSPELLQIVLSVAHAYIRSATNHWKDTRQGLLTCKGVPVIKSRCLESNNLTIWDRMESTFLMRWASSMTMYSHEIFLRPFFSRWQTS